MTAAIATWERRLAHSIVGSLPWLLLSLVLMLYLGSRFSVGAWSGTGTNCMPDHELWLLDRHNRDVGRGDPVVFTAGLRMAPFFPPELLVVKRLVGLPGDHVVVGTEVTTVNGEVVGEGLDLAKTLKQQPEAFHAEFVVAEGTYFVLGDTRDSYDGRYWGPLPAEALRGRAYGLF
jgi:conjugal transfer pilin signal peptidase TrbI